MAIPHRQVPHQGAMPQNSVVCHWISNPPRPPSGALKVLVPETDRPARSMMVRSEEHTSELQSLMRISYAVFCLKKKTKDYIQSITNTQDLTINNVHLAIFSH